MRGFNYKKSVQALNFFASFEKKSFNNMKAIKLVWMSDRLHLRTYGRTITGDIYFAMPYGPVASTTLDLATENPYLSKEELDYRNQFLLKIDSYHYKSICEPVLKVFSETDREVLYTINKQYGPLGEFDLSELSHSFPEWNKFESELKAKLGFRFPINQEDFFLNVKDPAKIFIDDEDSLAVTKAVYHENQKLTLVC
jgi:hypothetical protein